MQYRYGAGGVGSFLIVDAAALFLANAFGGTTSSVAACCSSSSCFGGSGSAARNFKFSFFDIVLFFHHITKMREYRMSISIWLWSDKNFEVHSQITILISNFFFGLI